MDELDLESLLGGLVPKVPEDKVYGVSTDDGTASIVSCKRKAINLLNSLLNTTEVDNNRLQLIQLLTMSITNMELVND